jgi:phosphoribosylglycinamide formyltransferase-1
MTSSASTPSFTLVVLLSGKGSNFQAILEYIREHSLNISIATVISNKADAKGLVIAQENNIDALFIDPKQYPNKTNFDLALQKEINKANPDLIVLAGFMRILSNDFVEHFSPRLINIHPSLLPKFKGLHTHQRALDDHESEHGCSVHYVSAELDGGPVIAQVSFRITEHDNLDSLQTKVQQLEHKLYPLVIQWISEKRVSLNNNQLNIEPEINKHELPCLIKLENF